MSANPYAPDEQFPGQLYQERTWLEGAIFLGVAYGVELTLFVLCLRLLVQQTNRSNYRTNLPLIVYICTLFLLGTLFMTAAARMTQLAFIDNRNFPGGPAMYERVMFSIPVDALGNVAFIINSWLADGLMVYRWLVIYRGCRVPAWIYMALPVTMLFGSFVIGTLFLVQIGTPASSPWSTHSINFTLPYFCISLALNIISTFAIVVRLIYFRRRISMTLGTAHGKQYTTIMAMLVESAALYSTFSLLFLIPFGLQHPIQNTFVQVLSAIQVIAPLLILLRVAKGRAWSSHTGSTIINTTRETSMRMKKFANIFSTGSGTLKHSGSGPAFTPTGSYGISVRQEVCFSNDINNVKCPPSV